MGQKDPGLQFQDQPAGGGFRQLGAKDVIDPIKAVAWVQGQPIPERLRLAVPQAGQVAQALAP